MSRILSFVLVVLSATTLIAQPFTRGEVVAVYPRQQISDVAWIGDSVPVYSYAPAYDMAIEVGGEVATVRWQPVTPFFPAVWNPGREVEVQPGRHSFVLKRDAGEAVRVPVISRESSEEWRSSPQSAPTDVLPPTFGWAPQ